MDNETEEIPSFDMTCPWCQAALHHSEIKREEDGFKCPECRREFTVEDCQEYEDNKFG